MKPVQIIAEMALSSTSRDILSRFCLIDSKHGRSRRQVLHSGCPQNACGASRKFRAIMEDQVGAGFEDGSVPVSRLLGDERSIRH